MAGVGGGRVELTQKTLADCCQILLTRPARKQIGFNIKPRQCAEYDITDRGLLARKKLISCGIEAQLIICNDLILRNAGERQQ